MAYSPKQIETIFNDICTQIGEGKSLRAVLRQDKMPSSHTFFKWVDSDKKKMLQYTREMNARAEDIFEDILDIADDQEDDIYINSDGVECVNHNVHARSRIRIDSRKWMLGKMQPKKYGDRVNVDMDIKEIKPIITKRSE